MRNSQKLMLYGGLAAIIGATGFIHGAKNLREQQEREYEIRINETVETTRARIPYTDIYSVELVLGAMAGLVGGVLAHIGYSVNKEVNERLEKARSEKKYAER